MTAGIRLACDTTILMIPLSQILPTRRIDPKMKRTSKYQCIAASVRELGLVEPLVVFPQGKTGQQYLLLDGHVRFEVLLDLKQASAKCLIAHDDEAFTYNHKVNRLSAIQEHFMILRAVKNGVSAELIARTLNVDVAKIKQKRDLLDGICPEAVQILREKRATAEGIRQLRKVKPIRQIEMAELMCATHNFSQDYAKCLVAATPQELMLDSRKPKEVRGLSVEDMSRMEHEMELLVRDFKVIEESHGKNTLNLVVVVGYLKRLLDNARVVRFLAQNYSELLTEFQKLVETGKLLELEADSA